MVEPKYTKQEYNNLLDEYILKFHKNFDKALLSEVKVVVAIVGFTPEPLAMNIDIVKPEKVYLLYTPDSKDYVDILLGYLNHKDFSHFLIEIDNFNIFDTYEKISSIIVQETPAKCIIDISGGKKSMVSSATFAAASHHVNLMYADFKQYSEDARRPKEKSNFFNVIKCLSDNYTVFYDTEFLEKNIIDITITQDLNDFNLHFTLKENNKEFDVRVTKDIRNSLYRDYVELITSPYSQKKMIKFSDRIISNLIPKDLIKFIKTSDKEFIRFTITEKILDIPWELINLSKALNKKFTFIRKVFNAHHALDVFFDLSKKIKFAIIANPDGTLPGAQKEGEVLYQFLRKQPRLHTSFYSGTGVNLDTAKIIDILEENDFIHFSGHGFEIKDSSLKFGWKLTEKVITPWEIEKVNNPPYFLFANSCVSGFSRQISNMRYNPKDNLVKAFLDLRLKNFIVSPILIPDTGDIDAIIKFYDLFLNKGEMIASAFAKSIMKSPAGYMYQLYGDYNTRIKK